MSSGNPRREVTTSGISTIIQDEGAIAPSTVGIFTDGDATPTISGHNLFRTGNTSSVTITDFVGVTTDGYVFRLLFSDIYTTIAHNSNIDLPDGEDWGPGKAGDMLEFTYDEDNSKWLGSNVTRMK